MRFWKPLPNFKNKAMKEILNTSDTALINQNEDKLNNYQRQVNSLVKALKLCHPITGTLLFRIIEKIDINYETVSR